MNAPQVHVRVRNHKAALACKGQPGIPGLHHPTELMAHKRAVAQHTKVMMPERLMRCRRYLTSPGCGLLCVVIYVTVMIDHFQIIPILPYL